jgi:hypothetical protein
LDDLFSYDGFLAELAEGKPRGGESGRLIQSRGGIADTQGLLQTNVFRPGVAPGRSRDSMWPVVIFIASALFLGDVVCRRVIVSFDWVPRVTQLLRWKKATAPSIAAAQRMDRLKSIKANATARFDQSTDFVASEYGVKHDALEATVARDHQSTELPTWEASEQPAAEPAEQTEFTSRLLQAKRRVHDRDRRPRE